MPEGLIGPGNGGRPPIANPGQGRALFADGTYGSSPFNVKALFSAGALPVAGGVGDWLRSEILSIVQARRIALEVSYDAAATTTGFAQLRVLTSSYQGDVAPVASDDVWFDAAASDGSISSGATAGAVPTGALWTAGFAYGQQTFQPMIAKVGPSTTNSAKARMKLSFDVADARWFMLLAREGGDPTHPGTLGIRVVAST